MLIINEAIRQELGLEVHGKQPMRLANNTPEICTITEAVEVHWKDRSTVTSAVVLDGAAEVLLGAVPLEGMDLIVDPVNQHLVGAHGDIAIFRI